VYDTASFSGATSGFTPDSTKVSFTFNGADAGSGSLTSNTEGPLSAGNYTFKASFAGDSNYVAATSPDEPLTIKTTSLIEPTGTTCQQFMDGSVPALAEVDYKLKSGKINSVSPGVFFYYTQFTKTAGLTKLEIDQDAGDVGYEFKVSQATATSQITLYDNNCNKLTLPTVNFETDSGHNANSDFTLDVSGLTNGSSYTLSVKYDSTSITGKLAPSPANWTDTFSTIDFSSGSAGATLTSASVNVVK